MKKASKGGLDKLRQIATVGPKQQALAPSCLEQLADGRIKIKIHAKPNAKTNSITGISEDLDVQIAAPPKEGEANEELISYLSSVLEIRKSDLQLDKV